MDLGHSTRDSISNPQETAEYRAIVGTLQSEKETKVSTDASSYGLGGVLLQKDRQDWRLVFYASRLLTDMEQKYAQVEKEALTVTWCCEKFSEFLIGLKIFTIETDHKPLLALLKTKHLYKLTPRIQRFQMRMM